MHPRVEKKRIEYYLSVFADVHAESGRECIRFHFRTAEEFQHFNYRIDLDHELKGRELTFLLKGIRTGVNSMPETGNAHNSVAVFDMSGEYSVRIVKRGGASYAFQVRVNGNAVSLASKNMENNSFVEVSAG